MCTVTLNGKKVASDNCYIQFIWDSKVMAIVTAGGAFYLPAIAMIVLYAEVYRAINKRKQ